MTTKTTMPEPVAWEYRDDADMRQPGSGTRLISFVRMAGMANERPLVYSDQNETYANDRVREALEEAASIARENYLAAYAGRVDVDEADDDDRNTEIFNVGQVAQALAYTKMEEAIRALIPATK